MLGSYSEKSIMGLQGTWDYKVSKQYSELTPSSSSSSSSCHFFKQKVLNSYIIIYLLVVERMLGQDTGEGDHVSIDDESIAIGDDSHNDSSQHHASIDENTEVRDPRNILAHHSSNDSSRQEQNVEEHHASVEEIIEIGDPSMLADDNSNDSSQYNGEGHDVFALDIKFLADNIKKNLDRAPSSDFVARHCIYRVHPMLRKTNEKAYTPVVVPIGPFHRGERSLQAMEECKLIYMRDLLARTAETVGSSTILEECVECIKRIVGEARSCYSEPIDLTSDEFVEMMVLDGLFIIELFRRRVGDVRIEGHDPIFSSSWHASSLIRDLALLENQLPMLVLEILIKLPTLHKEFQDNSIPVLALDFFYPSLLRDDDEVLMQFEGKHLLDLLDKTFHPLSEDCKTKPTLWNLLPSVTQLKNAGVEFKKGSINRSFLDIKFSGGVFEIPPIFVEDYTDSLLRNLIASEQCSSNDVNYIASYASLMNDLINSGSDVCLLRKQGIITSNLGSDEDDSNLFNNLCREVTIKHFYYSELYDQVHTYCKKRRHVWRATLMRNYFNSPWTIISFVAAILLILLTLTASLFAVLSFSIHKS